MFLTYLAAEELEPMQPDKKDLMSTSYRLLLQLLHCRRQLRHPVARGAPHIAPLRAPKSPAAGC